MHKLQASVLLALLACSDPDGTNPTDRNLAPGTGSAPDASMQELPGEGPAPADAALPLADAGQDAAPAPPSDPPTPALACGDDLDAHNGRVHPDVGVLPPARTFTGDPLEPGALGILSHDQQLDNPDPARSAFAVTTYAPSSDGRTIEAGPFPLLVLLPGFSSKHTGYGHFTDHLVSHGIAVLGITPANVAFTDTPNNPANVDEIEHALDWALGESPLAGHVDEAKLAIAGHSQGGKLAFFTAVRDARLKLVIGWDPQNGGGAPCFIAGIVGQDCNGWPVAPSCDPDRDFESAGMLADTHAESLVFAARDGAITPDKHLWAEHFYRGAPSPASLVLFPRAGHGDWAAQGAVTDVTKRVGLALLLSRFLNVRGLEAYLPGGSYLAAVSDVEVHAK